MTRYAMPRKVELPKEEKGNFFNDERTKRKKLKKKIFIKK